MSVSGIVKKNLFLLINLIFGTLTMTTPTTRQKKSSTTGVTPHQKPNMGYDTELRNNIAKYAQCFVFVFCFF